MLRYAFLLSATFALLGCSTGDFQFWEDEKPETKVAPPPEAPDQPTMPTQAAAPAPPEGAASGAVSVVMKEISSTGIGTEIGTLSLSDSDGGLVIAAHLTDLTPGDHGFHLHQNASCAPANKDGKMSAGEGAGGHFDPDKTGKHLGPLGNGHEGDMPVLSVGADGTANGTVAVPRLKVADVHNHTIVIHEGGDNFLDKPKPNGGGGNRIACGVVP